MIFSPSQIDTIFDSAKRYKIQQKRMEWISALRLINEDGMKENILEIGACNGGTTFTLSHFCKNLITIDHLNPSLFSFDEIKSKCNYTYYGMSSHEESTFNLVKDIKFDVIFIDGDHTYEGSKRDFDKYSKLLTTDGIIIFHDIIDSAMHQRHNCNVARTWDEVKSLYEPYQVYEFCFDCEKDLEYKREYIGYESACKEWGGVGVIKL